MESNRQQWNLQQQALRKALKSGQDHQQALNIFLAQHARVHSALMAGTADWSFEDEVWQYLTNDNARHIPPGGEHSIAWLTWHMARIEDVTMNLLVAGAPQLFLQNSWFERINVSYRDTGNASDTDYVQQLSAEIDLHALREYRLVVGRRTRQVVSMLSPGDLKTRVNPAHLQRVAEQSAVSPDAKEVLQYWGRLTIAGLLLMPPTRHNFIHLNEALRIKIKLAKTKQA